MSENGGLKSRDTEIFTPSIGELTFLTFMVYYIHEKVIRIKSRTNNGKG
jgi:hypothetical protein